jgi:hypothetical protein
MNDIDLSFSPEERLFGPGEGHWRETTVQAGTTSNVVPYSNGFRDAGDMLVKQGIETQMQDFVAFPALYCYRHALELAMKDVVYEWERGETGDFEVLRTHGLMTIWERARTTLEKAWPEGDTEQLNRMEAVIGELALVDPNGEQFRYDLDREGFVRDLPDELMRFDLPNVSRVMNKLITLMWGALDGIAHMRDAAE